MWRRLWLAARKPRRGHGSGNGIQLKTLTNHSCPGGVLNPRTCTRWQPCVLHTDCQSPFLLSQWAFQGDQWQTQSRLCCMNPCLLSIIELCEWICICVYRCMYACMFVYIWMSICVDVFINVCAHVPIYACLRLSIPVFCPCIVAFFQVNWNLISKSALR